MPKRRPRCARPSQSHRRPSGRHRGTDATAPVAASVNYLARSGSGQLTALKNGSLKLNLGESLRSEVKMSSKRRLVSAILNVLLLCACSSPPSELSADWRNGAKRGWIVGIFVPDSASEDIPSCLARLSPAERSSRQFVKFRYWHARQTITEVAELPPDLLVKIDDRVEVWPDNCSQGKVSRISRVLTAKE